MHGGVAARPPCTEGRDVTGWLLVGIVLVIGIALYVGFTLWVANLLERRRKDSTRL